MLDLRSFAVLLKKHVDAVPDYGQAFLRVLHFFLLGEVLGQMQLPERLLKGSQELLAL